jgi:hypothetical protein
MDSRDLKDAFSFAASVALAFAAIAVLPPLIGWLSLSVFLVAFGCFCIYRYLRPGGQPPMSNETTNPQSQGQVEAPLSVPVSVYCSQWASCGWKGKRRSPGLGVQPKPCPQCGKDVLR